MANVLVNEDSLTGIADAIRGKNGSTDTYKPSEMAAAISAISGGGGPSIPDSAFVISGDCSYWDYNGKWDTFIEAYKDKWSTNNLVDCSFMFSYSKLTSILFDINVMDTVVLASIFASSKLTTVPIINGNNITVQSIANMFSNMQKIKNIPDDYFNFITDIYSSSTVLIGVFNQCNNLRNFPSSFNSVIKKFKGTSYIYSPYYNLCYNCNSLNEITNLGITPTTVANNEFSSSFDYCRRLKSLTFESNQTANWKNHTINLSLYVGYGFSKSNATAAGISVDKEVKDATTYAALKDDVDWWTNNIAYSRYNHDSAVATINSLPDTSAYLATAGGTNTIKFRGAAGSATDGGAINTLTEEEIAVAAAKGWTVTLV